MFEIKESDLYLFPSPDGGELNFEDGQPLMDDAFDTAIYVSLVGSADWWGNEFQEVNEALEGPLFSELNSGTLTNQKRLDIETRAKSLLAWMVRAGIMKSVEASAFLETPERLRLTLTFQEPDGTEQVKKYRLSWTNQKLELGIE